MFSKILTFSILSVFCVLTGISSVFGQNRYIHTHDGYRHGHTKVSSGGRDILVGYTPPTPDPAPDPDTDKSYIHYHNEVGTGSQIYPDDVEPFPPVEVFEDPPSVNQQPVNQPTVNQPTVTQPTVTQPTITSPVASATPAAEAVPQSRPQEPQPARDETPIEPITQTPKNPMITEYMLRDFSSSGGRGLPKWIEIYNGNAEAMDLKGYQFTYAWREFSNSLWQYKTETIGSFVIPADEAKIITDKKVSTRFTWAVGGLTDEDIWVIPNKNNYGSLKNGWHIADPSGKAIYRIGRAFDQKNENAEWDDSMSWGGNVHLPPHTSEGFRVSYQYRQSEQPDEDRFYGSSKDSSAVATVVNEKTTYQIVGKSSPGFYSPVEVAPTAPALIRPKKAVIWGKLKQVQ